MPEKTLYKAEIAKFKHFIRRNSSDEGSLNSYITNLIYHFFNSLLIL